MTDDNGFSLGEVQQWMQQTLLLPGRPGEQLPSIPTSAFINDSQRLTAQRHLDIYRRSYIARLRECMKNQFSALAFALGEELFQSFADDYLTLHPSESYTLNALGAGFAGFLEATRPDAASEQKEDWPDFMIELARFEYSLSMLFDETVEEKEPLASTGTPDEQLALAPVFRLFRHSYPVSQYYLDFTSGKEPELPFAGETHCVVTRRNYRLGLFRINPAQALFLGAMQRGLPVGAALAEVAAAATDAAPVPWEVWRAYFIASGFFVEK